MHGSRGIPGDWRQEKEQGGGMVLDWGVHLLDQILQKAVIEGREESRIKLEEVMQVMRLMEAIFQSAEEHRAIDNPLEWNYYYYY